MQITAVNVVAINGNTAEGDDASAHSWTSEEDWTHFVQLRDTFDLIVMDDKMYDSVQPQPEAGRLRVIMTERADHYVAQAIAGQLEFVDQSPTELVRSLDARGFTSLLLAGGYGNTAF